VVGLISGGGRLNLQLAALCPVVWGKKIQRSSVVERSAVNRLVVGSNPTAGANSIVLLEQDSVPYVPLIGPAHCAAIFDTLNRFSIKIFQFAFTLFIDIDRARGGAAW
jgi:hypothetical protein